MGSVSRLGWFCVTRVLFVVLAAATSGELRAERPRVYALTGATIVPAPGESLEDATLVLRDGLIEAVGPRVKPPVDAEVIVAEGLWVHAGLIDAHSSLGAPGEPSRGDEEDGGDEGSARRGEPASPTPGAVHPLDKMRAEYRVRDSLTPFSGPSAKSMERIRNLGFTTVLSVPSTGILRGRSTAILLLEDLPVSDLILGDSVAQHGAFERGRFGTAYPTSLMGNVAAIRQTLLDTRRFEVWTERWEQDPTGLERPPFHATFDALLPVVGGQQKLIFLTEDVDDTLLIARVAQEFDLDLVICTSGAEWEQADALAATGRTLILSVAFPEEPKVADADEALTSSRRTLRRYLDAAAGPSRLHAAGVPFAFTLHGLENTANFHKNMAKMIAQGLDEDVALAALTTVPAGLLGLGRVLGTLEPGKLANVVVTDGPLFAEDTKVREVYVDGRRYEIKIKEKPEGDPDAVVDPRGTWSVTFDLGLRTVERTWTLRGDATRYHGTAETRDGTVDFEDIVLEGNVMTVTLPPQGRRGALEISVIVEGEAFEGSAEMGPRTVTVKGVRTGGPDGSSQ